MQLSDFDVQDFVDKPKDFHKTDIIHLYDDRYRINVWTVQKAGLIDKFSISKSYFVTYENGQIVDRTK